MWLVAKFKKNEFNLLKNSLKNKLSSSFIFYQPKILKEGLKNKKKYLKEIPLIGNYVFIFNKEFSKNNILNFLSSTKGLEYFLKKSNLNQTQIELFINTCKNFEDNQGYIKPNFFKKLINFEAKFLSGPFINQVFKIIEKRKNYIKILLNDIETKIYDETKYLYQPI